MSMDLAGINNINEYYTNHYFAQKTRKKRYLPGVQSPKSPISTEHLGQDCVIAAVSTMFITIRNSVVAAMLRFRLW